MEGPWRAAASGTPGSAWTNEEEPLALVTGRLRRASVLHELRGVPTSQHRFLLETCFCSDLEEEGQDLFSLPVGGRPQPIMGVSVWAFWGANSRPGTRRGS